MADETVQAKAANLSGMIDYQDSSVVSRTLIDKKTGTLTIFAFAEGQGLSEHAAPFDAFVYILDGEAEITVDGRLNVVAAGEMIIMPANKTHALKAARRFKMMLVMIRN